MLIDSDLNCIGAAINNNPSVFLPMLLAYIENSVYNKVRSNPQCGCASAP